MKIILISTFFFLFLFSLNAQDTTLPQGKSLIYLKSGKTIKQVCLRKIDRLKVEYVKNGNLADIYIGDVKHIETPVYLMEFDANNKILKRYYDLIIPYYGDTIRCFIQNADERKISFTEAGAVKQRNILKSDIKEYIQWPVKIPEKTEMVSPGRMVPKQDSTKAMNLPITRDSAQSIDSIVQKTHRIPDQIKSRKWESEKLSGGMEEAFYYHQSYQRGIKDASLVNRRGWGISAFFLGMIYGAPYVSVAAANSTEENVIVPGGVDAELYKSGYQHATIVKKTRSATCGAAVAKGVVTAIFFLIVFT